ncbi:MAG: lipoate--protein ligase family protein [Candidatus Scalindua sp. AMX11]|nr:MAG: lipoate--protein ligase family protein [Candidatus Scalindua sp.]NOG85117.1 lipoate--protein ligase family protein [Planctomycetota bacterium]RZV69300.1 MAG: lipoate--protein ligase family protein [Candidatus Scalindua sp. SCAELEC01]TDE66788.1 MAG: lipoate--protein ligase family protein [Candidatus Scalindua sp. AMX11]GJQ60403.1 MAG: lipoate--protein ligase family protein [Candidatus Scalindua sp.]
MDFIDTGFDNAYMNMAIDEVLLASTGPLLRLYQWQPVAVSIGRFQDIHDIDVDFCKRSKIDIVRRITGGKSVLHEKQLTYSFIIDRGTMPRSIIDSYNVISSAITLGLHSLGLDTEMNKVMCVNRENPVCFQEPSFNEIVMNKRKIVGSAQTRRRGRLLQHGSILTGVDIKKLSNCFIQKPKIHDLSKSIAYIDVPDKELKSAMKYGFSKLFETPLNKRDLSSRELSEARVLAREKYRSREWIERYQHV